MIWLGFNECNPTSLALPLLLYAIWFLDQHRLGWFSLFAALALMTGELVGLTIAALGVWYALKHHRVRRGVLIATVGASWTVVCLALVIPAFNNGRSSRYYDRFESVGGSPVGLLRTAIADPGSVISAVSTGSDLRYLLLLALPTAFIFVCPAAHPCRGAASIGHQYDVPMDSHNQSVAPLLRACGRGADRRDDHVRRTIRGACSHPGGWRAALLLRSLVLAALPPLPGADRYLFPPTGDARAHGSDEHGSVARAFGRSGYRDEPSRGAPLGPASDSCLPSPRRGDLGRPGRSRSFESRRMGAEVAQVSDLCRSFKQRQVWRRKVRSARDSRLRARELKPDLPNVLRERHDWRF